MVIGACLSDAECHVILWVSCFPTFLPVIRLVAFKLNLRLNASPSGRPGRILKTLSRITGLDSRDDQE